MELSISFESDELRLLAELLGEPLPPPDPPDTRSRDRIGVEAARERLLARNVLVEKDDGLEMAVVVARLIQVLARPQIAALVHRGSPEQNWREYVTRLSVRGYVGVQHDRIDGAHRLTPFATQDLLRRVALAAGLKKEMPAAPQPMTVSTRRLRTALMTANPDEAERQVSRASDDPQVVEWLREACAGERAAVRFLSSAPQGASIGLELAWLAGPGGAWRVPLLVTPLEDESDIEAVPEVDLEPVSGRQLLTALAQVGMLVR